jgi:multidrug efflux pump subunit AcrA (membrane-fusion protein)
MAHISPDDVVPALHKNLAFSDTPQGLGTGFLSVKNFATGEETYLRGFEYSLARMLDGRRTAQEVVRTAEALGLPVTLSDLEGFVKKLEDRHLVGEEPEKMSEGVSPWRRRDPWNPQTRELFRAALRNGRTGKLEQAISSLDVLLGDAPSTIEAVSLRRRLDEQRQSPQSTLPFRSVFAQTERNWKLSSEAAEPESQRTRIGFGRAGLIAAALALLLALLAIGALLIPLPRVVNAPGMLVPFASPKITAPRTGTVDEVPVKAGQWVESDTVLFSYDVSEELAQLEAGVTRLEGLHRKLYSRLPRTPAAREARSGYERAEADVTRAQADLESLRGANDANFGDRLELAEASVDRALQSLFAAQNTLSGLVPPEQLEEVAAQRAHVQALQRQLLDVEVRATQSGVLRALTVQPGMTINRGAEVGQIDDVRKLRAVATLQPQEVRAVAKGLPVLVLSNGRATQATVTRMDGNTIEVVLDNSARTFEPGPAEVQIRGKPVPLVR